LIRVIIRTDPSLVSFAELRDCVQAITETWQSNSLVPAVLRCAELLGETSGLSLTSADQGFELEATLTEPVWTSRPLRRQAGIERTDWPKHPSARPSLPAHSRLAGDLRDMTGLSAAVLARAFGVSREQYSRWVSGKPISDIRHGQLQFLHTVVRELVRRLGASGARTWLHTPTNGTATPVDLLRSRQLERFYREVVALPVIPSAADSTMMSLSAPIQVSDDEEDAEGDPWSPYDSRATADS
jgi:transcriptional regulator with XRE-family HTH domain